MFHLPSTPYYRVEVINQDNGDLIYAIINQHTEVIEYTESLLPQILLILNQLSEALEDYYKADEIPGGTSRVIDFPTMQ